MYGICISQKPEGKCSMPFARNTFKLKPQYSYYPYCENFSIQLVIEILMEGQWVIFLK